MVDNQFLALNLYHTFRIMLLSYRKLMFRMEDLTRETTDQESDSTINTNDPNQYSENTYLFSKFLKKSGAAKGQRKQN